MEKFTKAFVTKEVFSMGRVMCGVMSAEGEMFVAFVRDKKQAEEFMQLFGAPGVFITAYCRQHSIACEERRMS